MALIRGWKCGWDLIFMKDKRKYVLLQSLDIRGGSDET